jgi:hypothetical protein
MMNPALFDPAILAALGCFGGMSHAVERLLPDNHNKSVDAAGRQVHFPLTIRARGHVAETISRL